MKRNVPAFQPPPLTPEPPEAIKAGYRILLWGVPLLTGVYFLTGISPPLLIDYWELQAESVLNLYSHFCHQIPERTLIISGTPVGFCSRCTGFYGGLFLSSLIIAKSGGGHSFGLRRLAFLVAPAMIDFWLDLSALVPGSNVLRSLTGLLAGFGIVRFAFPRLLRAAQR